jgi:hypothetical protein
MDIRSTEVKICDHKSMIYCCTWHLMSGNVLQQKLVIGLGGFSQYECPNQAKYHNGKIIQYVTRSATDSQP